MELSTAAPTAGPTSDLDPFANEFLVDPFPALEELRETGPVVYLPEGDPEPRLNNSLCGLSRLPARVQSV